ncbi:MAG: DUF354 domain-containing protein [Nitrososphaeria archaeon]
MKIWFDALTPKQFLLFHSLKNEFEKRGVDVWFTSRDYEQVLPLIRMLNADVEIVGKFGGGTMKGKLQASILRSKKLLRSVSREKPDAAMSGGSPESARIAYGLTFPHFCMSDSPHSPVFPLCLPITEILFSPWIIRFEEWRKHGISRSHVRHYKALDPVFWLTNVSPKRSVLQDLRLKEGQYVLVRVPEVLASYLLGVKGGGNSKTMNFIRGLPSIFPEQRIVIMTRYSRQGKIFRRLGNRILLVDRVVDGTNLVRFASLFIGGGGTMTQEAALLGVPAISIFPGPKLTVMEYLRRKGLVTNFSDPDLALKYLRRASTRIIELAEKQRKLCRSLWRIMNDPKPQIATDVISWTERSS